MRRLGAQRCRRMSPLLYWMVKPMAAGIRTAPDYHVANYPETGNEWLTLRDESCAFRG